MIKEAIAKLIEKQDLSFKETAEVFLEILEGKATPSQLGAFLVAFRLKGETDKEISAAATVVREKAYKLKVRDDFLGIERKEPVLDTCGTGGSGVNKFNISTAVAFVVSAAGVKVAKHGNKAMSSNCGSADVLECMGININTPPRVMEEAIKKVGIGFLYAPLYHPAFKVVSPVRKEIGIRTVFNILGPLCNPALADHQLLGVFSPEWTLKLARALKNLGIKRAFVVYGQDLKDEVSLTGQTYVRFLDNKKIREFRLTPRSFGLKRCKLKDLEVKNVQDSAKVIWDVFNGRTGVHLDIILANASTCFYILKKVRDFKSGVHLAQQLISKGKVKEKFIEFKRFLAHSH